MQPDCHKPFDISNFMNSVRLNNLGFTPSGWKDIGIRKFEFVVKIQILSKRSNKKMHKAKFMSNKLLHKIKVKIYMES